ncbi:hypothetical protein [Candidatus Uabimicrobium sp. HlEnr_7]
MENEGIQKSKKNMYGINLTGANCGKEFIIDSFPLSYLETRATDHAI